MRKNIRRLFIVAGMAMFFAGCGGGGNDPVANSPSGSSGSFADDVSGFFGNGGSGAGADGGLLECVGDLQNCLTTCVTDPLNCPLTSELIGSLTDCANAADPAACLTGVTDALATTLGVDPATIDTSTVDLGAIDLGALGGGGVPLAAPAARSAMILSIDVADASLDDFSALVDLASPLADQPWPAYVTDAVNNAVLVLSSVDSESLSNVLAAVESLRLAFAEFADRADDSTAAVADTLVVALDAVLANLTNADDAAAAAAALQQAAAAVSALRVLSPADQGVLMAL